MRVIIKIQIKKKNHKIVKMKIRANMKKKKKR